MSGRCPGGWHSGGRRPALRRLWGWMPWLALLSVGGVGLALLVAWSGIINIAVTAGHPVWMEKFLALAMRRSVEANSDGLQAPAPGTDLLPLGAAHFHGNCAICHGAPGQPVNPTFASMLPHPPPLQEEADDWRTRELFWIGYHGLQFTGMPAWSGKGREDEMWAVAAFLRELPSMEISTYRTFAEGNTQLEEPAVAELVRTGMNIFPINTCDRCHGTVTAPAVSSNVPRLGGQSREYLLRALWEYRDDRRQSGFMEPVAVALRESQLAELADYYAGLQEPPHTATSKGDVQLGRELALRGDPPRKVPPCLSCHGEPRRRDVPSLAGQAASYIEQQLSLWRAGGRQQTHHGQLMAQVAKRLSSQQAQAVAAYFASRPVSGGHSAFVENER